MITKTTGALVVSYVYDSLNRRVSMTDQHDTTNYSYNELSLLTEVERGSIVRYAYDELGRKEKVVEFQNNS